MRACVYVCVVCQISLIFFGFRNQLAIRCNCLREPAGPHFGPPVLCVAPWRKSAFWSVAGVAALFRGADTGKSARFAANFPETWPSVPFRPQPELLPSQPCAGARLAGVLLSLMASCLTTALLSATSLFFTAISGVPFGFQRPPLSPLGKANMHGK